MIPRSQRLPPYQNAHPCFDPAATVRTGSAGAGEDAPEGRPPRVGHGCGRGSSSSGRTEGDTGGLGGLDARLGPAIRPNGPAGVHT